MTISVNNQYIQPDLVVSASTLSEMGEDNLKIIDLRSENEMQTGHIPGAVKLDYGKLVCKSGYAEGMLPPKQELERTLARLGITPQTKVVAYDADSGIRAARFLWTLAVCGHSRYALLDGGMNAWMSGGFPVSRSPIAVTCAQYRVLINESVIADYQYVTDHLGDSSCCLLDVRSDREFVGQDVRAKRGGHIPGAVHYEWSNVLKQDKSLRDPADIRSEIIAIGVSLDRQIIPYCQSNRRSAHTFLILKWLGYPNVRAYTGSWSEWGNMENVSISI